jgi:hypothetical protein
MAADPTTRTPDRAARRSVRASVTLTGGDRGRGMAGRAARAEVEAHLHLTWRGMRWRGGVSLSRDHLGPRWHGRHRVERT